MISGPMYCLLKLHVRYAGPASRGSGRAMSAAAAHWAHCCSRVVGAASDSLSYSLKAAARAQLPQRSANVIIYPGNARCAQLLYRVPEPSTAARPPPAARREASDVSCPPSAGRPPIPTQPRKHAAPINMRSTAWPVPNRRELYPNLLDAGLASGTRRKSMPPCCAPTRRIASDALPREEEGCGSW